MSYRPHVLFLLLRTGDKPADCLSLPGPGTKRLWYSLLYPDGVCCILHPIQKTPYPVDWTGYGWDAGHRWGKFRGCHLYFSKHLIEMWESNAMWLMTKYGFYSIVRKAPGTFHVRSREIGDILTCSLGAYGRRGKCT